MIHFPSQHFGLSARKKQCQNNDKLFLYRIRSKLTCFFKKQVAFNPRGLNLRKFLVSSSKMGNSAVCWLLLILILSPVYKCLVLIDALVVIIRLITSSRLHEFYLIFQFIEKNVDPSKVQNKKIDNEIISPLKS